MTEGHEKDPPAGPEGEKDPTGGAGTGPQESPEFGEGKGPAEADTAGEPQTKPGAGGYTGDRDPKSDMPAVPSVPETQDDPMSHDAAPSDKTSEPPASN